MVTGSSPVGPTKQFRQMTNDSVYAIRDTEPSTIVLNVGVGNGTEEMLKISKDGFYVRGVKVPQDENEAQAVYNAFLQWMSYAALTRNY